MLCMQWTRSYISIINDLDYLGPFNFSSKHPRPQKCPSTKKKKINKKLFKIFA